MLMDEQKLMISMKPRDATLFHRITETSEAVAYNVVIQKVGEQSRHSETVRGETVLVLVSSLVGTKPERARSNRVLPGV